MERVRVTYPGAYHHAMSRGYDGKRIFADDRLKLVFLDRLREASCQLKIRILAYCLMDNHYHLVLENTSGRLSDFFKVLNGSFGAHYRKIKGGRGYVFQGRFQSELIQDDAYLITAIAYVLQNPVKAGLVEDFMRYPWSSARSYYQNKPTFVERDSVRELFGSERSFLNQVQRLSDVDLPLLKTNVGMVIGGEERMESIMERFNRRNGQESLERRRWDDRCFEPLEKVIQVFERSRGVKIEDIDVDTYEGKRLRGDFLVRVRDFCGFTYRQIATLPLFSDVQLNSLGKMYRDARIRIASRSKEVKHRGE